MIHSQKELRFYILSDRIMAGYEDGGLFHKLKFRLKYSPIIVYLKHMRYCAYYRNSGGGNLKDLISISFLKI